MTIATCYPCAKYLLLILNLFFWVRLFSSIHPTNHLSSSWIDLAQWFSIDHSGHLFSSSSGCTEYNSSLQFHHLTFIIHRNSRMFLYSHRYSNLSHWFIWLLRCQTRITYLSSSCPYQITNALSYFFTHLFALYFLVHYLGHCRTSS